MRQFFVILFSVAALFIFSSVALAQNTLAHPKKARIVARGKVETAPKRKDPAAGKKFATAPKPMLKKSAGVNRLIHTRRLAVMQALFLIIKSTFCAPQSKRTSLWISCIIKISNNCSNRELWRKWIKSTKNASQSTD